MTATQILEGALADLGVVAAGDAVSAEDAEQARVALNDLGDALGLERLTLYTTVRTPTTLSSGTASYTVGSGGDIDIPRPDWIERATIVIDNTASPPTEVRIKVLELDEYAVWPEKALQSSQPIAVYYDHGFDSNSRGLIYPLPIPDVSTIDLVLYTPGGYVSEFADLTTDYALPRGHKRALRKNLALEIAPMFQATPSPLLFRQAEQSKAAIQMVNVRPILRAPEFVGSGHFNPRTGYPNRLT